MEPTSDGENSPPAGRPTHGRQRPGAACEECRRRKLRCDGLQPQCSVCQEAGVVCEVNTRRANRGPKKGYLKALKNRVAMLESRLADVYQEDRIQEPHMLSPPLTELPDGSGVSMFADFDSNLSPTRRTSVPDVGTYWMNSVTGTNTPPTSANFQSPHISDLMRVELDQLYFDRVHPSIQILHQRRYLSWSKESVKRTSQLCLQNAMWTLATLLSAQFQYLQDPLYQGTKQMLEHLNLNNSNEQEPVDTEQAQAWILLAVYESMRSYHQQAWMSAGRAFRLVQLMRLHEIDNPVNGPTNWGKHIEIEEQRRVFWMAYFLDHLFSIRNNWPITLNEHVICTRLPAPEAEFQSGQHALGSFLSEAVTAQAPQYTSAFNECIVLATICGRSLFHGQQYNVRCIYGDVAPGWLGWLDQHRWLDSILTRRLLILSQYYPSPAEVCDPMLLFANIMGQATIIYLYRGMESVLRTSEEGQAFTAEYRQRAVIATEQILSLAIPLTESHFFKVHPLMLIPLSLCAEFLYRNRNTHECFDVRLRDLLKLLKDLKNVNNADQSSMKLPELSCTTAPIRLGNQQANL